MDTRTGKIITQEESEYILSNIMEEYEHLHQIKEGTITPKQEEKMQVSKYDTRSVLGKIFTKNRKKKKNKKRGAGRKKQSKF